MTILKAYSQDVTDTVRRSVSVLVEPGRSFDYAISGTFTGYVALERTEGVGSPQIAVATSEADTALSGTAINTTGREQRYSFRSIDTDAETAFTGTATCAITELPNLAEVKKRTINAAGQAKAGTTAGFVVAAGNNVALVTCPASQTASTLVVPIPEMREGQTITGFYLVGQIESGGNGVTVDANLRKHTAAAADVADASVASITQLSVTADTIMSASNTRKAGFVERVGADETFYLLITATTGASTDIALQAVVIEYVEA